MQSQPTEDDGALPKARLDYVQRCFENTHELNRMMDQKANFLLAAVALVTAAMGVIASAALKTIVPEDWQVHFYWQVYLKTGSFVFLLIYLFLAFRVVLIATEVFRARRKMINSNTPAPGLLYPLLVMSRYPDETLYKNKLSTITYDDIIEDYSNQIVEVSNIYNFKQEKINDATDTFQVLVWFWVVTIVLMALTAFLLLPA